MGLTTHIWFHTDKTPQNELEYLPAHEAVYVARMSRCYRLNAIICQFYNKLECSQPHDGLLNYVKITRPVLDYIKEHYDETKKLNVKIGEMISTEPWCNKMLDWNDFNCIKAHALCMADIVQPKWEWTLCKCNPQCNQNRLQDMRFDCHDKVLATYKPLFTDLASFCELIDKSLQDDLDIWYGSW
jgi:hypothetical protein